MKRFAFIALLFFASCNDPAQTKINIAEQYLSNLVPSLSKVRHVIIIPGEGCGGCITQAGNFVKKRIDSLGPSYAIIFTGVKDQKLFALEYGQNFEKRTNVYMDTADYFMRPEISSFYPQIIAVKNNKVVSISVFEP